MCAPDLKESLATHSGRMQVPEHVHRPSPNFMRPNDRVRLQALCAHKARIPPEARIAKLRVGPGRCPAATPPGPRACLTVQLMERKSGFACLEVFPA